MTYHIKINDGMRVRLILDPKQQFPEKVYAVASDGFLIKWNDSGTGVILCPEQQFEKHVMKCYPGFVKIPNYANIRRLFREYGFDWTLYEDDSIEFEHPCLVKGKPNLLSGVKTRRKSLSSPSLRKAREYFPSKKILKPERRLRKRQRSIPEETESSDDSIVLQANLVPTNPVKSENYVKEKPDLDSILNVYAKNELSEEELLDLVYKKSSEIQYTDRTNTQTAGYEWLYSYPLTDSMDGTTDMQQPSHNYQRNSFMNYTDAMQDFSSIWNDIALHTPVQEPIDTTPFYNENENLKYHQPESYMPVDTTELQNCDSPKTYHELKTVHSVNSQKGVPDALSVLMTSVQESFPMNHRNSDYVVPKLTCCDCHCHKTPQFTY